MEAEIAIFDDGFAVILRDGAGLALQDNFYGDREPYGPCARWEGYKNLFFPETRVGA